jgi:hypothetical protein
MALFSSVRGVGGLPRNLRRYIGALLELDGPGRISRLLAPPQLFRYRQFWPFGGNGHLDPNLRKKGGFWRWHWAPVRLFVCVIWLPQKRRPRGAGLARIGLFPPRASPMAERIGFCFDQPNAMGLRRRSNFHLNEKRACPATRDD